MPVRVRRPIQHVYVALVFKKWAQWPYTYVSHKAGDQVMSGESTAGPKRRGRPKGIPASPAQKAAAKSNQAKATAAKRKRGAERRAAMELEKPRWKQLEDGDIAVADLTMDELIQGACANNDGTWEGRRHRLEPRMLQKMETERRRRIKRDFDKLAPDALDAFSDLINDVDNPAQRLAASKMVIEHQIGSVPKEVHVSVETEWERMGESAFQIVRSVDAVVVEDEPDDVVEAEIVEE